MVSSNFLFSKYSKSSHFLFFKIKKKFNLKRTFHIVFSTFSETVIDTNKSLNYLRVHLSAFQSSIKSSVILYLLVALHCRIKILNGSFISQKILVRTQSCRSRSSRIQIYAAGPYVKPFVKFTSDAQRKCRAFVGRANWIKPATARRCSIISFTALRASPPLSWYVPRDFSWR